MRLKRLECQKCGTWVDAEYTHYINGVCHCVLCALGDSLPRKMDNSKAKDARDDVTVADIEALIDEAMPPNEHD